MTGNSDGAKHAAGTTLTHSTEYNFGLGAPPRTAWTHVCDSPPRHRKAVAAVLQRFRCLGLWQLSPQCTFSNGPQIASSKANTSCHAMFAGLPCTFACKRVSFKGLSTSFLHWYPGITFVVAVEISCPHSGRGI